MTTNGSYLLQSSSLPPAQPAYVLRGHSAAIHAVHFFEDNLRLLTGDAEGWVVIWSVSIRRPIAVWKAHKDTILGLGSWKDDKILTHGRDSKLIVWQIGPEEDSFSKVLPIDDAVSERKEPWLLHSLAVNTLNFCSFAMCREIEAVEGTNPSDPKVPGSVLVATPGLQDGYINVTSLPNEERLATIPTPKDVNTGMIMTIKILYHDSKLVVLAGYESGHVAVWQQNGNKNHWQASYVNRSHSQPILSLDIAPTVSSFYTSSADAIVARHPFSRGDADTQVAQTKHAGQQSLTVRSDEKIFATAGWDNRVRVYSLKTMKELAVLKWHKEGCYAVAFAAVTKTAPGTDRQAETQEIVPRRDLTVSEQRMEKAKTTHWLAAGSKDGKVSMWDVY